MTELKPGWLRKAVWDANNTGKRVLITGGRHYHGEEWLRFVLNQIKPSCIIHGAAHGADEFADRWAEDNHIPVLRYHAEWERYGLGAGRIRNVHMLDAKPDLVLAFPGGKGTQHMMGIAKAAGIPVVTTEPPIGFDYSKHSDRVGL